MLAIIALIALLCWTAVLLLPWQPHRTRECFEIEPAPSKDLRELAVLIPARNEAAAIAGTLRALAQQGADLTVYVVDDESTDDTAPIVSALARELAAGAAERFALRIELIEGQALPKAWAGKLWALHQGLQRVRRPYTLLLDAEIEIAPGLLPSLLQFARQRELQLVSIMARLRCRSFWERLLVPPFIFFFKLLYPFALVNSPRSSVAGAAGGCMLLETEALISVGGFEAIRDTMIDDCSMAARLKGRGYRLWLGLGDSVQSMRPYTRLADFWSMVSRTAFTQLHYSVVLLVLTTVVMLILFVGPIAAIASPSGVWLGGLALLAMAICYAPVVRYYGLPLSWTVTLPLAACLFLAMTWSSALNFWRGRRAKWKQRSYDASAS